MAPKAKNKQASAKPASPRRAVVKFASASASTASSASASAPDAGAPLRSLYVAAPAPKRWGQAAKAQPAKPVLAVPAKVGKAKPTGLAGARPLIPCQPAGPPPLGKQAPAPPLGSLRGTALGEFLAAPPSGKQAPAPPSGKQAPPSGKHVLAKGQGVEICRELIRSMDGLSQSLERNIGAAAPIMSGAPGSHGISPAWRAVPPSAFAYQPFQPRPPPCLQERPADAPM